MIRVILGVIFGVLCGIMGLIGLEGLLVGATGYVISYYMARLLGISPLNMKKKRKAYSEGAMEYFASWFLFWTLVYTLTKASP